MKSRPTDPFRVDIKPHRGVIWNTSKSQVLEMVDQGSKGELLLAGILHIVLASHFVSPVKVISYIPNVVCPLPPVKQFGKIFCHGGVFIFGEQVIPKLPSFQVIDEGIALAIVRLNVISDAVGISSYTIEKLQPKVLGEGVGLGVVDFCDHFTSPVWVDFLHV
jgi:hypothetical protein